MAFVYCLIPIGGGATTWQAQTLQWFEQYIVEMHFPGPKIDLNAETYLKVTKCVACKGRGKRGSGHHVKTCESCNGKGVTKIEQVIYTEHGFTV